MYCPRCSEKKESEGLKFCSRCGLPLDFVSDVVEGGGFPLQMSGNTNDKAICSRQNGLFMALGWFIPCSLITVVFLLLGALPGFPLIAGVVGFVGALIIVAISSFLNGRENKGLSHSYLQARQYAEALPLNRMEDAQNVVMPSNDHRINETNEMIEPSSVVDETTKLFHKS